MKRFVKISVFLLGVSLFAHKMGNITDDLSDLNTFLLFLIFIFLYFPLSIEKLSKKLIIPALLIIVSAVLLFKIDLNERLFCLAVFVAAFYLLLRYTDREEFELLILSLTSFLFAFYTLFYNHTLLRLYLTKFSLFFSGLVSSAASQKIQLGSTALGIHITIIFALFALSSFVLAKKRNVFYLISVLFGYVTINALYVLIQIWSDAIPPHILYKFHLSWLDSKITLFLLCLLPLYFYFRKIDILKIQSIIGKREVVYVSLVSVLIFLSVFVVTLQSSERKTNGPIVFYGKGFFNWGVPEFGKYGESRSEGAVFGCLPQYLEASGFRTIIWNEKISEKLLDSTNTFVIISPQERFGEDEKRAVWNFVQAGGSLLVLGDHTDIGGIMSPLNDLLRTVGIRYNFDSAIPFEKSWTWENCIEQIPHLVTQKIENEREISISIGASLNITRHSTPLLIGKYAFSDLGNVDNAKGAYLGNMRYNRGEQFTDVVLTAVHYYGKGKVLVFGDTSSFQNGALPESYDFIKRIFAYLSGRREPRVYTENTLLSLLFLSLAFAILFVKLKMNAIVLLLSSLLVFLALSGAESLNSKNLQVQEPTGRIAYVDNSHIERYSGTLSDDNAVGGLYYNLMRNGYLPIRLKEFSKEKILQGKLLVLIAPAKSFTQGEIDNIRYFTERGGSLIVSVGWEESEASANLLKTFGIHLENIPLGAAHTAKAKFEKWKIKLHEAWPVFSTAEGVDTLCTAWDYPIIILQPYRKGKLLVIGDSYFLLNRNLEGRTNYNENNILFLRDVLKIIRKDADL